MLLIIWLHSLKSQSADFDVPHVSHERFENKHETRKNKLGDGCYHVFLDVGANIGVHSRFLYEPDSYPDARIARSIFGKEFGASRDNRDFCVFAFEPNPNHFARHVKLTKHFEKLGVRYYHLPVAVSDSDGFIFFYHNKDDRDEEIGFGDHQLLGARGNAVEEMVPKIRLADWIMDEIHERKLPTKVFGNYSDINPKDGPKVVMKMDIESQEYAVLPDLMFSGVLCKTIDYVFGEFHIWWVRYEPGPSGRGGLNLERGEDGRNFVKQLLRSFHSVKNCVTSEISPGDDESHLHDGIPL
ncbi:hypothetical protein HJC23_005829 [Cyclotella cryptica]|uniref:Methyltransferase FkbM domain-containing protein n=1 Tax=Cyclotella cryptica TaxID=29204 RepID=A0ABD3QYT2_9STRA